MFLIRIIKAGRQTCTCDQGKSQTCSHCSDRPTFCPLLIDYPDYEGDC